MTKLQAHRGVCSQYPENTMAAFKASVDQGYDLIEFDPKFTKDAQIVILHDRTLNRTARKNGIAPELELKIENVTLEEAREYEYGSWFSKDFEGEQIPLFTDILELSAQTGIKLKIDNVWESFPQEIVEKMFSQIEKYGDKVNIGFTCAKLETMTLAANRFPKCDIHYDGGDLSLERLEEVKKIAHGHHLYVWVCFDNDMTKWFRGTKATPEVCSQVKKYGELGVWILSKREELVLAMRDLGAEIVETTGHIKPEWVSEISDLL